MKKLILTCLVALATVNAEAADMGWSCEQSMPSGMYFRIALVSEAMTLSVRAERLNDLGAPTGNFYDEDVRMSLAETGIYIGQKQFGYHTTLKVVLGANDSAAVYNVASGSLLANCRGHIIDYTPTPGYGGGPDGPFYP